MDRNKLNNHISNLRYATTSENAMNKTRLSNNTSGTTGVRFVKASNKWRAEIKLDGTRKHLGIFESKEEAIQARHKAEKELFKEYRVQNININNSTNITINNYS